MEHTHFHTNVNSGYDKAPYNRHIYSRVDPRGRMKVDNLDQQQKSQWGEEKRAKLDLEKHSRLLNQIQVQELRRQQLQQQSGDQNFSQEEHFDEQQQQAQDSTQPQI